MSWPGRPSLAPGRMPTGAQLEAMLDAIEQPWLAWATWTPTLTNLTLGNGTVTARYNKVGRTVNYRFEFLLGSTSAVGTQPRFTLPAAPTTDFTNVPIGDVNLFDTGTANRRGQVRWISASTAEVIAFNTTGVAISITSTAPHTWATGDSIAVIGCYEAAA